MTNKTEELKDRIEAKKHRLQASLLELKADARASAQEKRDAITKKLGELERYLADGSEKITDQVASKLNDWLE